MAGPIPLLEEMLFLPLANPGSSCNTACSPRGPLHPTDPIFLGSPLLPNNFTQHFVLGGLQFSHVFWHIQGAEKSDMLSQLLAAHNSIPATKVRRDNAHVMADDAAMGL